MIKLPLNPGQQLTSIKDMKPMKRGFDCQQFRRILTHRSLIHTDIALCGIAQSTQTRDGIVIHTFRVADNTGSIIMSVWGDDGKWIKNGDVIRIENAQVLEAKLFKGSLQLMPTRYGKIKRLGEDVMLFAETPNMSEFQWVTEEELKNAPGNPQPS
ncbi:hypothetical protein EV182_000887 [Spiromyces aspiralis]|uniref:Uncharacterized protein n=1 Tax=Spiromyces aspiralis TaxID=68401 RepID=A0ACC1HTT5_9FUNG|nr:hypothetical protein EV182_000887 [Spiromyces aspiralis]